MGGIRACGACLLVLATACGGEEPPSSPADVAVVVVPTAGPDTATVADWDSDAEAEPTPDATSTKTAVPSPPSLAMGEGAPCDAAMALALKTALKAREPSELAAGMTPDGSYLCLVLDPGQMVAVPITLQPGRCYTFLAHGFPNVIELDLRLKPNLGPNVPPTLSALGSALLAQDNTRGPVTSIGSGKTCFKNALPIPMAARVEAIAVQGGGPVAVQSYGR